MTLRLIMSYYGSSTIEAALEVDDDGRATGWQTAGRRVGRFARALTAAERRALRNALEAGPGAGDASGETNDAPLPPSGASEQLVGDGFAATFDPSIGPPEGLEQTFAVLRAIREDLEASPVAAIELDVSGTPLRALVRHAGTDPIQVRVDGALQVQITAYGKNSRVVDSITHTVDTGGLTGSVGAGWGLELIDDVGISDPGRGGFLSVSVGSLDVDSRGDGVLRQADLSWVSE
jgi:hypothetical protein